MEKAIVELEKQKEEEVKHKKKRTKSASLITPRQEIQQQKEKLRNLMDKLPIETL